MYYQDCELKGVYKFNKKEKEAHVMVQHREVSSYFKHTYNIFVIL